MNEYDIITGYLFRQFPEDFVKLIAGDTAEDIQLAETALKQIRHADASAYATMRSEDGTETEVVVHIEFQTDADETMPIRMAGYIGRLIDMYRRPIHATVIYLRPQEINDPGVYHYVFPNEFMAAYNVLKIWELDRAEVLAKRALGLLPFTPLMQPEGVSDTEWLGKCVQTIEAVVPNLYFRRFLGRIENWSQKSYKNTLIDLDRLGLNQSKQIEAGLSDNETRIKPQCGQWHQVPFGICSSPHSQQTC